MRAVLRGALLLAAALLGACVALAQGSDTGGRDLTIALFSTQRLARVTLDPLSTESWTARCIACVRRPLRTPLTVTAPAELVAGGALRVTDAATGTQRSTAGLWHLHAGSAHDAIEITVRVPSERYVEAVLSAEAAPDEPAESLRALAIVARTFALNGAHYTALPGHLAADLCDSTACQAVRFGPVSAAVRNAVRDTAGETLWFNHRRAEVFFSQQCGGFTEDAGAVWPRLAGTPYLGSHPDPYCLRRGPAAWHADIAARDLLAITTAGDWHVRAPLAAALVTRRSRSGRATELAFTGADGSVTRIPAAALRLALGRGLGWSLVRSDLYQLGLHNGTLVFDGRGHGHGVGLCQTGALEMARGGRSAREILAFYFPGTHVHILPGDEGWGETRVGPLTVRSTQALSPGEGNIFGRAWVAAAQRFPLPRWLTPTVILAPSPELFRQLTHQPGWDLASTGENTTVLQSAAILAANSTPLEPLLLHEFLHLRVEAEATGRAPLWLREGLVEVLAGESDGAATVPRSARAREHDLETPGSRMEAAFAHNAAAARVRPLLARYGLSTVRGWLSAGVPSGVE